MKAIYRGQGVTKGIEVEILQYVGSYEGPIRAVCYDWECGFIIASLDQLRLVPEPIVIPDHMPQGFAQTPGATNIVPPASNNKKGKR